MSLNIDTICANSKFQLQLSEFGIHCLNGMLLNYGNVWFTCKALVHRLYILTELLFLHFIIAHTPCESVKGRAQIQESIQTIDGYTLKNIDELKSGMVVMSLDEWENLKLGNFEFVNFEIIFINSKSHGPNFIWTTSRAHDLEV